MPVDAMFFTGSYGVGRTIAKQAGVQMMKYQVELGGKCPVYVTEDVNVASAAASIAGKPKSTSSVHNNLLL
jgi:coniferyl-aldehyde dehydrogenase